jgi:hypothetical protein
MSISKNQTKKLDAKGAKENENTQKKPDAEFARRLVLNGQSSARSHAISKFAQVPFRVLLRLLRFCVEVRFVSPDSPMLATQ